jgi:membrane associated rhomboid family serine protease
LFPLSDDNPTTNYPAVNHLLIGFNIIAFIAEFIFLSQGGSIDGKLPFDNFALVPARFVSHFSPNEFGTIFSSMFMHAGFSHIIGNLWFLYIFGDNVEDRMGSTNYLLFYLTCGIFADLAHILTNPLSAVGCVGASGAISGVLGAYLVLYPGVKVHTWITWYWRPRVDAWILIGLWFFSQVVYSLISNSEGGGTAWFAHIGGFVCGIHAAQNSNQKRSWWQTRCLATNSLCRPLSVLLLLSGGSSLSSFLLTTAISTAIIQGRQRRQLPHHQ